MIDSAPKIGRRLRNKIGVKVYYHTLHRFCNRLFGLLASRSTCRSVRPSVDDGWSLFMYSRIWSTTRLVNSAWSTRSTLDLVSHFARKDRTSTYLEIMARYSLCRSSVVSLVHTKTLYRLTERAHTTTTLNIERAFAALAHNEFVVQTVLTNKVDIHYYSCFLKAM